MTETDQVKIKVRNLAVHYGETLALSGINLEAGVNQVLALIGPSGCGKSTFLRCLNRMNDTIAHCRVRGAIEVDGRDIYAEGVDATLIRARIGMVFQKPNPFPKSIFDNVAFGSTLHKLTGSAAELDELVKDTLERVGLIDEVGDRLFDDALGLSGGQQQRLCIARALAVQPDILVMDEPCSALDPVATAKIEDLIGALAERLTIVIVTHSMEQAARISQRTAFFHLGEMVEINDTEVLFTSPQDERTNNYITGRFG